jgi:hypothetical protein
MKTHIKLHQLKNINSDRFNNPVFLLGKEIYNNYLKEKNSFIEKIVAKIKKTYIGIPVVCVDFIDENRVILLNDI